VFKLKRQHRSDLAKASLSLSDQHSAVKALLKTSFTYIWSQAWACDMPQKYIVTRPFKATSAISGREREFKPGDWFLCDSGQRGETITIEVDLSLLLIDRKTFETCCKFKNEGELF
jgi:hypothetical protein